ncbi:MAG: hypothetical protein QOG85_1970 [Gaiellaceae bacterium]|nr:hypothetical protein [Gaiellaceae bacterium]
MTGAPYRAGQVEVAIMSPGRELTRLVAAKQGEKRCLVMMGPRKAPVYCVLAGHGAYYCPYSPVTGPRRTTANATLTKTGALTLDMPLTGTHAARPLAWQRYPHVDGYIHPWTSDGRLRSGLRLVTEEPDHGGCFAGSEEVPDPAAISCLVPSMGRASPCYPQKQRWGAGDIAACARLGSLSFMRMQITARS